MLPRQEVKIEVEMPGPEQVFLSFRQSLPFQKTVILTPPMVPLTRTQVSKAFMPTRLQERMLIGSDQVIQAKFEIQFDLKLEMSSI